MQKITILKKLYFLVCFVFLTTTWNSFAQIVIGTPSLGFSQACANEAFNSYNVSFVFSPPTGLAPTNQFIIEMSDADGNFADAVTVFTSEPGAITATPATVAFSLPTDTAGENYRLRVKSTAPAATSSGSISFAAYFKMQDSPFTINNMVPTGVFCSGSSYLLTIDNPGTGNNDSPLNYPSLTFNWFRETGPTTSVLVGQGSTYSVNTPGTYFVETDYGTCTSDSYSNRVTVSEATSGITTAVTSSLGNPFCPENGPTTLATISGIAYQWYKNGVLISGATQQTYETSDSGTYTVSVNLGDCEATGSIDLVSEGFESSINVPEVYELADGETFLVIVSTNAVNPIFEWFYNGNPIPGANSDSYLVSQWGNYQVVITQTSGCNAVTVFSFEMGEPYEQYPNVDMIPNIVSPNGDGINDTWMLPQRYVSGTGTQVTIMTSMGEVVLQTNDYQNNWPMEQPNLTSVNKVYYYIITTTDNQTKKGSITLIK